MTDRSDRLRELLEQRILILDGAMGTMIQRHKLTEADYRGARFADWPRDLKGNNDLLVLTKPEVIRGMFVETMSGTTAVWPGPPVGACGETCPVVWPVAWPSLTVRVTVRAVPLL